MIQLQPGTDRPTIVWKHSKYNWHGFNWIENMNPPFLAIDPEQFKEDGWALVGPLTLTQWEE